MSKKDRKKKRRLDEDEARQQRLLDQLKMHGRAPAVPSSYFHDTGTKQRLRKNRQGEKHRLKDLATKHNQGDTDGA